jgi:hypothetical protein
MLAWLFLSTALLRPIAKAAEDILLGPALGVVTAESGK